MSDWDAADLAEQRRLLGVRPVIADGIREALERCTKPLGLGSSEVTRAIKGLATMGVVYESAFIAHDFTRFDKNIGVGKKTAHLIRAAQQVMRGTAPAKAATKSAEKRCPHCGHKVRDR